MVTKTKVIIPDTGFFFDADKHRYYLDAKQLTGVTTILDILAKPALIQWAANLATARAFTIGTVVGLAEEIAKHKEITTQVAREIDLKFIQFKEARTAHAQKRDKSADIGTLAHAWCESWIKGLKPVDDPNLKIMTDNFVKWATENQVEFLETEKVVYSREHWYAGTFDFLCRFGGKTYLGDIKTGGGIYKEMFWQTAGYHLALKEQEPETQIDGHIIVNITKDGKLNVESNFDWETSQKGFLSALTIYRILNNY